MDGLLKSLGQSLSKSSKILTEGDADYDPSMERWGGIDVQRPAAVVQPATEEDVVLTVRETIKAGVPFVPTSGGHSPWSSIDKKGIVIDLRLFKDVVVDQQNHVAKVRGGLLMKEFQIALCEKGEFTTVANGNTVGVIPYMVGGGVNVYQPLIGYGVENVLAARIITAKGDIVTASETENPDLLWAIRGAGQFFGLILELTIRTYSQTIISHDGTRRIGNYFFTPDKAVEACQKVKDIVDKNDHASAGHVMILNNPFTQVGQVLLVSCQYYGTEAEMTKTFQPLLDLGPVDKQVVDCGFRNHSDHLEWMLDKSGYKRFSQTGLADIHPQNFGDLCKLFLELAETTTGMERSVFTIEWHTPTVKGPALDADTCFGFKDVHIWLNVLTWYNDPKLHDKSLEFDSRAVQVMRSDTVPEAYIAYTNTSRDDPIEQRYKGVGTVQKLKALKQTWDPTGIFTSELL